MKNIALITARGGSKGLPRKNVLELNGKPLIAWSIEAAIASENIDIVYVSTEDTEIADISLEFGAEIIQRPQYLGGDTISSELVIAHAIEYLAMRKVDVLNVCLLQPTSPLRTCKHIDEAFALLKRNNAKCVLSVFEPRHSPVKSYKLNDDGTIVGMFFDSAPYCRRQDLPIALQPNGAIYLFPSSDFLLNSQIPRSGVFPLVMSELESADIDTIRDLNDVEIILKREKL